MPSQTLPVIKPLLSFKAKQENKRLAAQDEGYVKFSYTTEKIIMEINGNTKKCVLTEYKVMPRYKDVWRHV